MSFLVPCPDSFSLESLAARICASSNFRFSWQFYRFTGIDPRYPVGIRRALADVIAHPDLHRFLRDSFVPAYDPTFHIGPVHEHCVIANDPDAFANTLATAANDHAGAYSKTLRDATTPEKQQIHDRFSTIGDHHAYDLRPGNLPDCPRCRDQDNHVFSTWFYGVAWDFTLFATWPAQKLLWMGCLTDTD